MVTTPTRNYTASDHESFFDDIAYPVGKKVLARTNGLIPDPTQGPGVAVSCLFSTGVPTPLSFTYSGGFEEQPMVSEGDGDGTVNENSLAVCEQWKGNNQGHTVDTKVFKGIEHAAMITNATVIAEVRAILEAR